MRVAGCSVQSRAFPTNARNFDRLQATPIRSRTSRQPIMSAYRGVFRAMVARGVWRKRVVVPLPLLEVEEEECVCVPTALRDASTSHRRHFTTERPSGAERPRSSHPRSNNASPALLHRALCMVHLSYPVLLCTCAAPRHNPRRLSTGTPASITVLVGAASRRRMPVLGTSGLGLSLAVVGQ